MSVQQPVTANQPRIADRLAAARRGRFVGRQAEVDLFRAALLNPEPPFAVLHIHGPGGIGKTTLLREYARVAAECDRPVVHLDGRNVDPSPQGFLFALDRAIGLEEGGASPFTSFWPSDGVLFIDTYETLTVLDAWLRETFLPQLPAQSLAVISGRNPPAPAWRTDIDWAELTHVVSLRNLRPEESQTYLTTRGVSADQHPEVLAFTHGHPLALTLVADVLSQGDALAAFSPRDEPDMVRVLLERLLQDVPSPAHRQALEICTLVWATTEALLCEALELADAHELFEWLRGLSFIEEGKYGLFPHDIARETLYEDLRWRNVDRLQELNRSLTTCLHNRFQRASADEQQRVWFDLLYLTRHNPFMRPYFEWAALGSAYVEPATSRDHPEILSMVRKHQGDAGAQIAQHWLQRQPQAFQAYRSADGELFGFMALLTLHEVTPEDIAADPAVPAALNFMQRHGPARPGDEVIHLRFWMSRDANQEVSPAINLTAIFNSIYWMTHPRLAWNFITIVDPEFFEPNFTAIHMRRSPEADFEVGGQRYSIFAHDWRAEPAADWFGVKANLAVPTGPHEAQQQAAPTPPLLVLSQADFTEAVRQALRDYTRPERLATNPLMRSRLVVGAKNRDASPATLQALILQAATTLTATPKDMKLHRAIWHTYLEPAPTQERAAEVLDLPFNTYRYHLARGIERITDWLWQHEINGSCC